MIHNIYPLAPVFAMIIPVGFLFVFISTTTLHTAISVLIGGVAKSNNSAGLGESPF